jgi:hypothetical protein
VTTGLHKVTAGLSEVKEAFAQYHANQNVFGAGNGMNLTLKVKNTTASVLQIKTLPSQRRNRWTLWNKELRLMLLQNLKYSL